MRKATIPIAALLLSAAALLAGGLSVAANRVDVTVLDNGGAVAGVTVDIVTSDGVQSMSTDATGTITVQISGKHFGLRVNGVKDSRIYTVSDSPVTVTLP